MPICTSLTELRAGMAELVNTPELRFEVDEGRRFEVIEEMVHRREAEGADVNRIDGARVSTPEGWRLLRGSNSQNVLVARAEARNQEVLDRFDRHLASSGIERASLFVIERPLAF